MASCPAQAALEATFYGINTDLCPIYARFSPFPLYFRVKPLHMLLCRVKTRMSPPFDP